MGGKFQVNREIFDHEIWKNTSEFRLFLYILGKAVWKDGGVKVGNIHIKKGQFLRSYRNLRNDLEYLDNNAVKQYGIATIKRLVDKLVADGRIKKEETEHGTLFTVVNYELYQGFEEYNNKSLEQRRNTDGTAMEQQRNNKKKDKKEKKDNSASAVDIFFEEIWALYPNKKGKSAIKVATKRKLHLVGKESLEMAIKRYKEELKLEAWKHPMNGSTFFNGRYEDYLDVGTEEAEEPEELELIPFNPKEWE